MNLFIICILAHFNTLFCDCSYVTLETNFEQSDFVIQAKVIAVNDSLYWDIKEDYFLSMNSAYKKSGYCAILEVQKVYKGKNIPDTLEIIKPIPSMCDFFYNLDESYVLLGNMFQGDFSIGNCSKSFMIKSDEQLEEFEEWLKLFKLSKD